MQLRKSFETKDCEEILIIIGDIRKDTCKNSSSYPMNIIIETETLSLLLEIITDFYHTYEEMAYQGLWLLCNLAGVGTCGDILLDKGIIYLFDKILVRYEYNVRIIVQVENHARVVINLLSEKKGPLSREGLII